MAKNGGELGADVARSEATPGTYLGHKIDWCHSRTRIFTPSLAIDGNGISAEATV